MTGEPLTLDSLTKSQKRKLQKLSRVHEVQATIGVVNLLFTCLMCVQFPAHYWIWHVCRTSFYLPLRYFRFKALKWHLYLLDWCYVVTYISTICSMLAVVRYTTGLETVLVHYNTMLIRAGFAMACGPLAWSVFVFRNSIVFHDADRSTSVFIHLSPFALFWCFRWGAGHPSVLYEAWPDLFKVCETPEAFGLADKCFQSWSGMLWCRACAASPWEFILPPALLYLCVWSIPYYTIVLVWWRDWCEETKHETLYSYFCQTQPELVEKYSPKVRWLVGEKNAGPFLYMLIHALSMIVFCATGYIFWHSFLVHTVWMALVLFKAIDNGSSYMFRVFAYRYANECLNTHRDKLD